MDIEVLTNLEKNNKTFKLKKMGDVAGEYFEKGALEKKNRGFGMGYLAGEYFENLTQTIPRMGASILYIPTFFAVNVLGEKAIENMDFTAGSTLVNDTRRAVFFAFLQLVKQNIWGDRGVDPSTTFKDYDMLPTMSKLFEGRNKTQKGSEPPRVEDINPIYAGKGVRNETFMNQ
jgi:hypothetical protein